MTTRFIFNPKSGHNQRRPGFAAALRQQIKRRGLDAEIVVTQGPGHATELAREAVKLGCPRVVAVGGDGTMNEVAQALVHTPGALGLVPCGSGNGLALHLKLPTSLDRALDLLHEERSAIAMIDTGTANGFPFFNAMGIGLDAEVSRRFNQLHRRGLPAYLRVAVASLKAFRPETFRLACDGAEHSGQAVLVCIANSDQYGNHARIAPGARVDDGALDLVVVRPVSALGAVGLAVRLFAGNFTSSPAVQHRRGRRFLLQRETPGIMHTDGETHATGAQIEIVVHPQSLRLIVPRETAAVTLNHPAPTPEFALQLP